MDNFLKNSQLIHCQVSGDSGSFAGVITFVYRSNFVSNWQTLWQEFNAIGSSISCPWLFLSDFNIIL